MKGTFKMRKPQVSIAILTYNRGDILSRSLDCALNQQNCNIEVILVNNGSTDNTAEICRQYAEKDDRIRLFHRENNSIGAGRNTCLESFDGEAIFFLDDDDYMQEDTIAYLYDNMIKNEADIAVCGSYYDIDNQLKEKYVFDSIYIFNREQALYELMERKLFNSANPCKLFSRKTVEGIRYLPEVRYDDIHTIYRFFANGDKIFVSGCPKYYFVKHEKNNSKQVFESELTVELLEEYLTAYRQRTQYLSKMIPEMTAYLKYSEWSFYLSMYNKLVNYDIKGCDSQKIYLENNLMLNLKKLKNSPYIKVFEKQIIDKLFQGT